MKRLFTQDYSQLEKDADRLLEIFDRLPDDHFNDRRSSVELIVRKLKGFARVYQNMSLRNGDAEIIIN
nr:hypothetical protein [uncultured Carboxylicivirga sp.]